MFSMWVVIFLLFSSFCAAVVGAPVPVIGHRGQKVDIRCPYESGYELHSKYFCKGECIIVFKNIIVESGSPAKDERFSLTDNTTSRVFTVTITDLRTEDAGQYWCAVSRTLPPTDVYSEILLTVKLDNKSTEFSTVSSLPTTVSYYNTTDRNQQSTPITSFKDSGSVIYIIAGLLIMVIIVFLLLLTVLCKQRTSKKPPGVTPSAVSQHVSVRMLPLNTGAEITEEEFDCSDHKYQEISELQYMIKHPSTVYTSAQRPEDSEIYYTADNPEDSLIYSTAEQPNDSLIYSTADNPDDSMIYSTVYPPNYTLNYSTAGNPDDSMIYSTAEKTDDSMIYSTADKPDDSMIYSTADKPEDSMAHSKEDKPDDSSR